MLIIEDDALVRALLYETLVTHGYAAAACANRKEAIHILGKYPGQIHLLLTNLSVLGKDGLQELLWAMGKDCQPKVLLISGNVFCKDMQNLRRELAYPFIQNPFMPSKLLAKMKQILCA